jgi:His-Xaa-Ser system radical SAM maturase HxsC
MALPLVLKTETFGLPGPVTLKAVDGEEFIRHGRPPGRSVLLLDAVPPNQRSKLLQVPWGAVMSSEPAGIATSVPVLRHPIPREGVQPGDIIEVSPDRSMLRVLYRRGDNGNIIFATERCNSFCLMCSQPPREVADDWRIQQNIDLVELIDRDEPSLAITGGEPTLLGQGLVDIIRACGRTLPDTDLQVLSNGRGFADSDLAQRVRATSHPKLQWNIPLYADVSAIHDYVVQSAGAFDQTVRGLYKLAEAEQRIEIRVVLHRPTIPRLASLARFIYRNLSFVRHVALMGIEPIGFARANHDSLWIDPVDYQAELAEAVSFLHGNGIPVSIYNLPLCVLRTDLRAFAARSISNWKNVYLPACEGCRLQGQCAGFFASIDKKWTSRGVTAVVSEGDMP